MNLHGAVAFANSKNVTLNVHLTISWKLMGYGDDKAADLPLSKLFIKLLRLRKGVLKVEVRSQKSEVRSQKSLVAN